MLRVIFDGGIFGTEMANSDYFSPYLLSVNHFIEIKKETLQGLKVFVFYDSFNYILINNLLFSGGNINQTLFATHMLNNGAPLEVIQSLLGHEKSETTRIYAQLSGSLRQELYRKYF
ncbi:integrase [Neobacillus niacini]|nr:integrase [Neobacillus niacini]